jgi:hypothetical protein
MPRGHKGEAKTPGSGRKKGSPNKSTVFGKEYLMKLLSDYVESGLMESDLLAIPDPADRLRIIEKYTSYLIPKQAAVTTEFNVADQTRQSVIEQLKKLAQDNE